MRTDATMWCSYEDLVGAEVTQVSFDYAVSFMFQDSTLGYHTLRIEGDFFVEGPLGRIDVHSDSWKSLERSILVRLFCDTVECLAYSRTDELRIGFTSGNVLVCPGSQGFEAWWIERFPGNR